MSLIVHPNALKHGLSPEQVAAAYETGAVTACVRSRDADADPPRWATIGFDDADRAIELVFVMTVQGPLIFHANWLTPGFRKELRA